ncbi:MAG: hypothetical protein ACK5CY_01340 [Bacteroidia bacterium]
MKHTLMLVLMHFFTHLISAQDINDMNKKELRELLIKIQLKNDSILKMASEFSNSNDLLQSKIVILENEKYIQEKKLIEFNNQIVEISDKNKDSELKNNELISENDNIKNEIKNLNNRIKILNDSLLQLRYRDLDLSNQKNKIDFETSTNENDFLNNYFKNTKQLNNNSFMFCLDKIMIGNNESKNYGRFENEINFLLYGRSHNAKTMQYIPEIVNYNEFNMYGAKSMLLRDAFSAKDVLSLLDIQKIHEHLPKIEILKNKLLTLTFADGSQESFLFNLNQGENNSYRKTLQMELATEDVESDDSKNNDKDIIWKLFMMGDECYLAMNYFQLNRIKFPIYDIKKGIELTDGGLFYHFKEDGFGGAYDEKSSGKGFYFERKKDAFMNTNEFIDPSCMVFLFKLVEK